MCTSPQEAACEAFAYSYWAYYNHLGSHARTSLAQQRAWDHDGVALTARVNGGRPGFCTAVWDSPSVCKIVVAVEGMSSLSQLWQAWQGYNASSASPLTGNVYHAFKTYGDAILTLLQADDFFMDVWNQPQVSITFTGFSMGAAIAEYMAKKIKTDHAATRVACIKFASPRVGSNRWVTGNLALDHYRNWYLESDPISVIPYETMTNLSAMSLLSTFNNTFYAENPEVRVLNSMGLAENVRQLDGYDGFISAMVASRRTVDVNNPWYWHDKDRYRAAFTGLSRTIAPDVEARFRYLEYNDDNNWGYAYNPVDGFQPVLKVVTDPNPDDFVYVDDTVRDTAIVRQSVRNQAIQLVNPVEPRTNVIPAIANPAWRPRATRNR